MKLDPDVYVEAAELIADGWEYYGCGALDYKRNYVNFYAKHFKPSLRRKGNPWFSDGLDNITAETQEARMLSLLIMAEIVKDGQ